MADQHDGIDAIAAEHGWSHREPAPHLHEYTRTVTAPEDDPTVQALRAAGRELTEMLMVGCNHGGKIKGVYYGGFWSIDPDTGQHGLIPMTRHLREAVVVHLVDNPDMAARLADDD
jgi:hypothetical protein